MSEKKSIDKSLWISIIALLISLGTMAISIIETNIMKNQQTIMMDQKFASVWPYMQRNQWTNYGEEKGSFQFGIENKGVGPGLIQDVTYLYNGDTVETWSFHDSLASQNPEVKFTTRSNQNIDNMVISPGQLVHLVKVEMKSTDTSQVLLNDLQSSFRVEFCYCSIYGECWQYKNNEVTKSDLCKPASEDI